MTETVDTRIKQVLNVFRKRKVLTIDELSGLLQRSLPTARRWLKQWNCYTSYNRNGSYYALPSVPQFDSNGLWRYRGIYFSKYGNLTQTVVHLVKNSESGLGGSQLEDLLGIQPRSFLSLFRDHPDLRREKHQGSYVYFSSNPDTYARQRAARLKMIRDSKMPSEMEAVLILAEIIKHPGWDIDHIAAGLSRKKHPVTSQMIQNLLDAHELGAKKKL